jgi:hypothetical protein
MKSTFLFILLLFSSYLSFSQDKIFVLHPFVGDTIDNYEKNKFLLFPEINDSCFHFGLIHLTSERKYLLYSYADAKSIPKIAEIDSSKIKEYAGNIQKFIDYYTTLLKNADFSLQRKSPKTQKNLPINLNLSPEFYKKLGNDLDRYQFLNFNADIKGLWGKEKEDYIKTQGFITIPRK